MLLHKFCNGEAMKKYIVKLTPEERAILEKLVKSGKSQAKKLTHARILLKADESEGNGWVDRDIAKALDVGISTVERTRTAFVEESLEIALNGAKRRPRGPVKVTGEVKLILLLLLVQRLQKATAIGLSNC